MKHGETHGESQTPTPVAGASPERQNFRELPSQLGGQRMAVVFLSVNDVIIRIIMAIMGEYEILGYIYIHNYVMYMIYHIIMIYPI